MVKLPSHISHSQLKAYEDCRRSWYLGKVRHAEEVQAWYLAVGSAVHHMVEDHLSLRPIGGGRNLKAEDYFFPLVRRQMEIEPDLDKWLAAGSKDDPITGDKALQMVRDCFERALEFLEDIDVWEVEYDASGTLPGCSVEVKAFIDLVGEYRGKQKKYHGPMIVDWKTGSKKPDDFQLKTYGALCAKPGKFWNITEGKPLRMSGMYAMLKPGASEARAIDLSDVDPAEVGARYQRARDGMESMQIQAREDRNKWTCGMCFQKDNCLAWNDYPTPRSVYYDKSKRDQPPF